MTILVVIKIFGCIKIFETISFPGFDAFLGDNILKWGKRWTKLCSCLYFYFLLVSILCFLDSIYQCRLGHNLSQNATNSYIFFIKSAKWATVRNQIYLVTSMCLTVDTSSIFTKKSNFAKCFFDICNAEMAQCLSSLQKSEFLKFIISLFHYFWCQNWDQWHKLSGKNTHNIFFLLLVQK